MIYYLKKHLPYLFLGISILLVLAGGYVYYERNNSVATPVVKKLSVSKKEENKKKTVKVDVKGAVNNPGVYEMDDDKRIIDAINMAGGLNNLANTINLNLSRKVKDEMYIMVYTTEEIENYRNKKTNEEVVCAASECVCPDEINDACISKEENTTKKEENDNKTISGKVSINTASKEELMTLSGIGEAKAKAIIEYRNKEGSFKTIEDIKNVSGIGDSIYEKIKDNITI